MKITINHIGDPAVTVNSVRITKDDTIHVVVDTKEKRIEGDCCSVSGDNGTESYEIMYYEDENLTSLPNKETALTIIELTPENDDEREFIVNSQCIRAGVKYGGHYYIVKKHTDSSKEIGYWQGD
jgi:hypothetical protein